MINADMRACTSSISRAICACGGQRDILYAATHATHRGSSANLSGTGNLCPNVLPLLAQRAFHTFARAACQQLRMEQFVLTICPGYGALAAMRHPDTQSDGSSQQRPGCKIFESDFNSSFQRDANLSSSRVPMATALRIDLSNQNRLSTHDSTGLLFLNF